MTIDGADYEGESVRHLYGTALAVGMMLVMFFGAAWAYLQLLKLPVPPGQASALPEGGGSLLSNSTALLALAILVFTAVLAGLLAVIPWISPLASGLPGLLLVAWTALYLVSVRKAVALIPLRSHAFGAGWEALLFNGILGVAGATMVFPLFIPSRWRSRRPEAEAAFTRDVDDYLTDVTTGSQARQERAERELEDWERDDQALIGTVLSRPAATSPVDTSRVTGASRALRNTGSFQLPTRPQPRPTGSTPRPGGWMPRGRGTHRRIEDNPLLGDPYAD